MIMKMKRLINLCIILTIFLFSVKVSVAAENSESGEKGEYIQLALNADSLKEKMDKMDNEEKMLKNQQRLNEQREKQFKKIRNQLHSKLSRAGLKMYDTRMEENEGYFEAIFNCSPMDGGEAGVGETSLNIRSSSFKSSTDSLEVCSTGRRKREETCVSIAWDEVIDKKGGINLHRIEEESRSAIASFFNLPADTPLQDIVATQTSLSNEAKKKLQISKSYFNELRLKLENATEKALTKIASKTKMKFYQVSQADAENFSYTNKDDRRKMAKFFSYLESYKERDHCAGEIVDYKVFIIIKAKFGRQGDYIRISLDGSAKHLGSTTIERILSNYYRPSVFDLASSTNEDTEAHIEAGIADAVGSILENGADIIIEK